MNFYEEHLNHQVGLLMNMLTANDVLKEIRAIYSGNDKAKQKAYKRILFLATDDNGFKWIERALEDWGNNPMFNGLNMIDIDKCLMIKSYREICNKKRKVGDTSPITPEELVPQFTKDFDL